MNENKQFKSVEEKRVWGAVQYFTYNDGIMTHDEIEDLVNQLLEENEQLKSILEEMKDKNGEIWLMDGRIIRLKKVLKGDLK